MADQTEAKEPPEGEAKTFLKKHKLAITVVAVAVVALLIGAGVAYAVLQSANQQASETASEIIEQTADALDEPTWSKRYVMVHHDAVTHEVSHPAEYETVTEYHTVCNDCGAQIDGKAQEHIDSTGHSGYTRNVPVNVTKVAKEAWTETVTDVAAYDELVEDGEKSSDGQVRNNSFNDDGTPVEGSSANEAA